MKKNYFFVKKSLINSMCFAVFISSFSFNATASLTSEYKKMSAELSALESSSNGRLGVYLIDPSNKKYFSYKGDDRFPFCSTSKVLVISKILHDSQSSPEIMNSEIEIKKSDLVNYNPVTGKNVSKLMTISALSKAALQYSDNAAMNLLLQKAGGIESVNAFARSLGDRKFLLSRNEPGLNTSIPGDNRDTTTPNAMAHTLQKLILGNGLESSRRDILINWMKGNTTGGASIKAGVPANWIVADKTGTGDYGTTNDVAVMRTEKNVPVILVTYFTQFRKEAKPEKAVLAQAAKIVTSNIE